MFLLKHSLIKHTCLRGDKLINSKKKRNNNNKKKEQGEINSYVFVEGYEIIVIGAGVGNADSGAHRISKMIPLPF